MEHDPMILALLTINLFPTAVWCNCGVLFSSLFENLIMCITCFDQVHPHSSPIITLLPTPYSFTIGCVC